MPPPAMLRLTALLAATATAAAWDRPSLRSSLLHGCGHTSVAGPDVPCPNHCEQLSFPDDATRKSFLAADSWKYPKYTDGPCDAKFSAFEATWADKDFPTVTHVKKSTAPSPALRPVTASPSTPASSSSSSTNVLPIPGRHQWPDRDGYCG